jgi:hypothetical protein
MVTLANDDVNGASSGVCDDGAGSAALMRLASMYGSGAQRSERGMSGLQRSASRVALTVAMLVCLALPAFCASTVSNPIPGGLTVRRSMRAAPHRLIVYPNAPVVAVNQSQQFAVTDAQGNPVAVHWNVSGIGCSGQACGTIDEHGLYQPPASLPQPHIVTIEGVLESDPNYSVLTEVRLAAVVPAAASPAGAQIAVRKPQPLAAPELGRQNVARRADLPALPQAISAAPAIGRQNLSRSGQAPLPNAVASAPVIESQKVARASNFPPLPHAVDATPSVDGTISKRVAMAPLPNVVKAAPEVGDRNIARSGQLPPLPGAVAATPAVERTVVSNRGTLPLPNVIGAAPSAESRTLALARDRELLPLPAVVGVTPAVERTNLPSKAEMPPMSVTAPLAVEKQSIAHNAPAAPLPSAVNAPPVHTQAVNAQNVARIESAPTPKIVTTAPKGERPNVARNIELMSLPKTITVPLQASGSSASPAAKSAPILTASVPPPAAISVQPASAPTVLPSKAVPAEPVAPPPAVSAAPVLMASATPPPAAVLIPKQQQVASPVRNQSQFAGAILSPMQDAGSATRSVSTQPSPVTYADGELTIDSENLTLAAVLQLVAEKTGAVIELPPGTGQERIIEHAGPGRAEDVLASLLNGSPFDFVIVGSPLRPHLPTQVLLSLHKADDTNATLAAQPPKPIVAAYTPPPEPAVAAVQPDLTGISFEVPKEPLTPDDLSKLMKEKTQQLRERIQQQQQQ